jgi:membrane protease subunit (stomatin/prohibitin family)
MGIWDKLRGELIDIIEWLDTSDNSIAFRFERHNNEIKNGGRLIVRESQVAVFQNEGEYADVYTPGTHTLSTQNMPILSTLRGWAHGFNSPFKAEVIFVNTKVISGLTWGTKGPMMIMHPELMNVKIKAFGAIDIRVKSDPESVKTFLKTVVGTDDHFTNEEMLTKLRQRIIGGLSRVLTKEAALLYEFGGDTVNQLIKERLKPDMDLFGLEIIDFYLESHEFDEDTQKALNIRREAKAKKAAMGEYDDMNKFMQFQMGNSMENMSNNPGAGSEMLGAGMGFAMGNMMTNNMNINQNRGNGGGAVPPPLPGSVKFFVAAEGKQFGPFEMPQLQQMVQAGQLSRESMVWKEGMAAWEKAGGVGELSGLFAAVPPPPPPM